MKPWTYLHFSQHGLTLSSFSIESIYITVLLLESQFFIRKVVNFRASWLRLTSHVLWGRMPKPTILMDGKSGRSTARFGASSRTNTNLALGGPTAQTCVQRTLARCNFKRTRSKRHWADGQDATNQTSKHAGKERSMSNNLFIAQWLFSLEIISTDKYLVLPSQNILEGGGFEQESFLWDCAGV